MSQHALYVTMCAVTSFMSQYALYVTMCAVTSFISQNALYVTICAVGAEVSQTNTSELKFLFEGHEDFSTIPSYAVLPAMVDTHTHTHSTNLYSRTALIVIKSV